MKILAFAFFCLVIISCTPLGYPVNEGREYGNPRMPIVVTHASAVDSSCWAKQARPGTTFSQEHSVLRNRVVQRSAGKSLHPISYEKFKKKIAKNAKKGMYNYKRDTTAKPVRSQ